MTTMNVMGAGGDGIIFSDRSNPTIVTKAFYKNNAGCSKAEIEYNKQLRVYNCISCLQNCDDPLVSLINKYVRVAEPLGFNTEPLSVNNNTYDCSLKMRKLNGLPLSIYQAFDPAIIARIDPLYQEELGSVMAHLSFNSPITGLFGVKYSAARITRENPPRGYFSNEQTGFFDFLRFRYTNKLLLSDEELERIIGFVYGWIYFSCDIIPLDIEFTLGINPVTNEYEINVLDFGMTFDKRSLDNNVSGFESRRFLSIYGDNTLSQLVREQDLLERVVEDTGLDLYASLDEGSVSRDAFLITKNLMPCGQCRNLTFFVDLSTRSFVCSLACVKK